MFKRSRVNRLAGKTLCNWYFGWFGYFGWSFVLQVDACAVFKHGFFGVASFAQCPQIAALRRAAKHLWYFVVYLKAAIKQLVAQPAAVSLLVGNCGTHPAVDSTSTFAKPARHSNPTKFAEILFYKILNLQETMIVHCIVFKPTKLEVLS